MIRSGRLRHRVELQEPTVAQNTVGELVTTWTTIATVPAEVLDLRGREYLTAREAHAETTTKITLRYRDDLTRLWRVKHGARVFDVEAVVDLQGRRRVLELMCKERT